MGQVGARGMARRMGLAMSRRASFIQLPRLAALALSLAACRHAAPLDTASLDNAGMSYDAIQQLRALDIDAAEVSELARARAGGLSEGGCIETVRIFHGRHEVFHAGDAIAGLAGAGMSEERILELVRLDQVGPNAGEFQAMRLAGLSEATVLEVARHRAAGQPVLAGASLARLRNAGLRDATLLELARRGVPDSAVPAILTGRRHGATDAQILREFRGS